MSQNELPAGTRVGRVALAVADLDRQVAFYTDVVGLSVRERAADRATLGTDDAPLLELHASEAPERGIDETGLFHVAVRVPDRAALGAALGRIEGRWHLTGASDHDVSEALYLHDPEDNGVEIYRDRPRAAWTERSDGRVEMGTRPLDLDAVRTAGDGTDTVPDGTDIGHVHLEVSSIPAAREFYLDALGLRLRTAWEGDAGTEALFVAAGDYHHHLGLNVWNDRTTPVTGRGLAWVELVVPDPAVLDEVAGRLRRADVQFERDDTRVIVEDADSIELRIRTQT